MHRLPSGQPLMSANLTNAGDRNAPLVSPPSAQVASDERPDLASPLGSATVATDDRTRSMTASRPALRGKAQLLGTIRAPPIEVPLSTVAVGVLRDN
jgi:hypothetical protein